MNRVNGYSHDRSQSEQKQELAGMSATHRQVAPRLARGAPFPAET